MKLLRKLLRMRLNCLDFRKKYVIMVFMENNKRSRACFLASSKMQKIVSLCKTRGFVFPGSEIYGGLANTWDFGPLGIEMVNNIKQLWWSRFVREREDVIGLGSSILMNSKVWKASGHLEGFTDPLIECKKCKKRFRADHLMEKELGHSSKKWLRGHKKLEKEAKNRDIPIVEHSGNKALKSAPDALEFKCPNCDVSDWTDSRQFNLMFKTSIGPLEDSKSTVYLRPETAQGMFVNFKNIQQSMRLKLPFGVAQIGKAFRNEITPGNFIFRILEFEQMEIEYFVNEKNWEKWFNHWQDQMQKWLIDIGINKKNFKIREHEKGELSHYSKKTIDFEYKYPFGQKELYGLAYRTDFDLKAHQTASGENLEYMYSKTCLLAGKAGEKIIPHVIEPTFGVERTILALLCDAYEEVEARSGKSDRSKKEIVLHLDPKIAPIKAAILPLVKNKKQITKAARDIHTILKKSFMIQYDESGSIGKRYRRQDEIGTPYCITIDFDTLKDNAVTIRDRDTLKQKRIKIKELKNYLDDRLNL